MLKNKKFLLTSAGVILALFSVAVWATSASVEWNPAHFAPASIAPGGTMDATVVFTNRGPSTINGKKLSLEIRGDAAGIVSVAQPAFPQTVKKGESVSVNLSIHSPINAPLHVVTGNLALLESKPNGTTKDTFSTVLPLEITLSPFPLPPEPGDAGKVTLAGIDIGGPNGVPNGVRDDIDRKIGFMFPDSEKKRAALTEESRRNQIFLLDDYPDGAEGKMKSWTNFMMIGKAGTCRDLLFGVGIDANVPYESLEAVHSINAEFSALFQNTPDRARKFNNAMGHIGGKALPRGAASEAEERQECLDVGINPDAFAN